MKHPSDTFAQQTRRLASEVQRRRDWAGGDPARMGAVADALVELTTHRLSGHAWAEAASGVQEAVTLSAKVLAQHGPVGPYTPRVDAVRSVTALVQLALIQSTAGLHPQAEQALAAAFGLREQLSRLDLDAALPAQIVSWALLVWARAGLAAGEVPAANARADAAVAVGADDGEFLAVDVDRVASDARWAAGWAEPAVEYALRAVERYEGLALSLLERPAQLPAAMLDRLSEPLFGLYSDAADRVLTIGAPGLGLTLRRRLVDLLGAIAVRKPEAQQLLVAALSDLSDDLRGTGRAAEADDVAELAASITGDSDDEAPPRRDRVRLGQRASWTSLPPADAFGVRTGAQGEPSGRLAALRGPADAAEASRRAETEAELARRAREAEEQAFRLAADAERRRAEQERLAAEQTEREAAEAAEAAERERLQRQRKRAERIAEHERQLERERAEAEAALRARVSDETDEERAEREELERLAAELAALEASEASEPRHAVEVAGEIAEDEAEDEAVEDAQLIAAAEEEAEREALAEAERVAAEEAERARLAAEQLERERVAAEEAEQARRAEEAERERLAAEEAERARVAAEEAERARLAIEQLERERVAAEEAEQARHAEEAERERVAAEEAERERLAAEEAERERVAAEEAERARLAAEEAERERVAAEEAERARLAAEQLQRERAAAEQAEQARAAEAERERVAAEEAERERVAAEEAEQARRAEEAERERVAAEEAERERLAAEEADRERAAAEEAERERLAAEEAERERLAAEEAAERDALEQARAGVEQAAATGKRRDVRDASAALVDELRGRYEAEPERYLDEFLAALDQLATARWQAGDWWGSRGPSKEAKGLRKQHGR